MLLRSKQSLCATMCQCACQNPEKTQDPQYLHRYQRTTWGPAAQRNTSLCKRLHAEHARKLFAERSSTSFGAHASAMTTLPASRMGARESVATNSCNDAQARNALSNSGASEFLIHLQKITQKSGGWLRWRQGRHRWWQLAPESRRLLNDNCELTIGIWQWAETSRLRPTVLPTQTLRSKTETTTVPHTHRLHSAVGVGASTVTLRFLLRKI